MIFVDGKFNKFKLFNEVKAIDGLYFYSARILR